MGNSPALIATEGATTGQHVVVISGLSGAGKTATAKVFEDLGYRCVDNLPGELLPDLADLIAREPGRFQRVAIVLDARAGDVPVAFAAMRGALEGRGIRPQVFFLEARDEILIRRFSETRHRHPLESEGGIADSIAAERRLLEPVRQESDVVVDTSEMAMRDLRALLFGQLWAPVEPERMAIQLLSFGFKLGLPQEADVVFDVRFLQNPYNVPRLRPLSGLTPEVRDHVLGQPLAGAFLDRAEELLVETVPAYLSEGKARLTVALGCTGGFHRSIVLVEELAKRLRARDLGPVTVFHRELESG
jgi:RNase adapter protein RapZ